MNNWRNFLGVLIQKSSVIIIEHLFYYIKEPFLARRMNFIPMFTEEEERRLLLRLAGGRPGGGGWAEASEGLPAGEGAGMPALPPLNPHDFQRPAHRLIWKALVALAFQGLEISPRAVAARLPQEASSGEALAKSLAEAWCILGFDG